MVGIQVSSGECSLSGAMLVSGHVRSCCLLVLLFSEAFFEDGDALRARVGVAEEDLLMLESPGWKDHQVITHTHTTYIGIFTYIWLNFLVNVGEYTIHG